MKWLFFIFFSFWVQITSALGIDSLKVYTEHYSDDSSKIYLVADTHNSSSGCSAYSVSVKDTLDYVLVDLCIQTGLMQTTCRAKDTIYLGVRPHQTLLIRLFHYQLYFNSCRVRDSADITLEFTASDINALSNETVNVYPNPATNTLTIQYSEAEFNSAEILNAIGQWFCKADITNHDTFSIDVSGIPPGVYYVRLIQDSKRIVRKFVKL